MARTHRHFDKETGTAVVTIFDKFGEFVGKAKTHEEDKDLQSEITGMTIAELKAKIARATKRKNKSQETMLKSISKVENDSEHFFGRVQVLQELENELENYLENKELFRKRYRKIKAGKDRTTPKMK